MCVSSSKSPSSATVPKIRCEIRLWLFPLLSPNLHDELTISGSKNPLFVPDGWIKSNRTFVAPVSVNYRRLERGDVRVLALSHSSPCKYKAAHLFYCYLSMSSQPSQTTREWFFAFKFILFTERTSFIHSLNSTGSTSAPDLVHLIPPPVDPGECQSQCQPPASITYRIIGVCQLVNKLLWTMETHTQTPTNSNLNPTYSTQTPKFSDTSHRIMARSWII